MTKFQRYQAAEKALHEAAVSFAEYRDKHRVEGDLIEAAIDYARAVAAVRPVMPNDHDQESGQGDVHGPDGWWGGS